MAHVAPSKKMAIVITLLVATPTLAQASCRTVSGAQVTHSDGVGAGSTCKFPSTYDGFTYDGCFASSDTGARLWCYTKNGGGDLWGYCSSSCPKANLKKFGFEAYDAVTWTSHADDLPAGTVGTVVGFNAKDVLVKFPTGKWYFTPKELVKARHEQSCTSCFVSEIKDVLTNDCAASGLAAAEEVLKQSMGSYLEGFLDSADISAALSVTKSVSASVTKSVAAQTCTSCFDSVIAKVSESKCNPSVCYVNSLAAAAKILDWWVDQEGQCAALVSHYPENAPTTTVLRTTTPRPTAAPTTTAKMITPRPTAAPTTAAKMTTPRPTAAPTRTAQATTPRPTAVSITTAKASTLPGQESQDVTSKAQLQAKQPTMTMMVGGLFVVLLVVCRS